MKPLKKSKSKSGTKAGRPSGVDSETTRALLLEAAVTLFAKKGFDGASVKDISTHAGTNVSLVSYHFGGKEGLYRTCLEHFGKNRLAATERILQPAKTLDEMILRLEMFVDDMLIWFEEEPDLCALVHREADMGFPIAREVFQSTFLKVFTTLVAFVRAGQSKSYLRSDFDPQIATSLFFSGLTGMVHKDELTKKTFGQSVFEAGYRKKFKNQVCRLFIEGVKK